MLSRLAERFGLDALGVLATVLYALPSLGYPFGMDQPVHWYIGKRWLEGLMPYATGVDTKPPGVFAIHALSVLLLGDHQWSVRVVDLAGWLGDRSQDRALRPDGVHFSEATFRPIVDEWMGPEIERIWTEWWTRHRTSVAADPATPDPRRHNRPY